MKRQKQTWYLPLGYNAFETVNTLTNRLPVTASELENVVGEKVYTAGVLTSNISVIAAILPLSVFIFHQLSFFTKRSKYLSKKF